MPGRSSVLSGGAGALLLACLAAVAQEGRGGDVPTITDQRAAIALSDAESAFIRREMRGLLESVRDILDASIKGDRAGIIVAARRAGLNGPEAAHIPASLAPKLPLEFKKLGLATHRAFDQIAVDAEQSRPLDSAPKNIAELMGNCIACHSAWRVVSEERR